MKILYHWPNPDTVYAGRTISTGYKNAFEDMGHSFKFMTADSNQEECLISYKPDIFITSLNSLSLKYLNLVLLGKARKKNTRVFVNTPFWTSPFDKLRLSETSSLKNNDEYISLIKSEEFGDVYYNICEQNDERMKGFKETVGYECKTLLLAADKTIIYPEYSSRFQADISYIGTNLPDKKLFFNNVIDPLRLTYQVKLYGQDWTAYDKAAGFAQKIGQYFNIPILRSFNKPKLDLTDERKIYSSSIVSINVHEHYQKTYGDLNERTFKIPLAGGFEVVDEVSSLNRYFKIGKEIVVARDEEDWKDKLSYYIKSPEKRIKIIEAGSKVVSKYHTYHNRAQTMLDWYTQL